jgi:hypothetical protein
MIGLMYVLGFLIYFAVAASVVFAVTKLASKHRAFWASIWALAFFLIPFWDLIPTLAAFHYYCGKDGGAKINVSLDEWAKANRDVLDALQPYDPRAGSVKIGQYRRSPINQYIAHEVLSPYESKFLTIRRKEERVVDIRSGLVLAQLVDYRSGFPGLGDMGKGTWKVWLSRESCWNTYDPSPVTEFVRFQTSARKIGRRDQ